MKSDISEYESLRSELISCEELQLNVWLTMVTSYFTVYVLSIEYASYHLLLLTYFIIWPLSAQIQRYRWNIQKISLYLKVFFQDQDMYWEAFNGTEEGHAISNPFPLIRMLRIYMPMVFSVLTSIGYIGKAVENRFLELKKLGEVNIEDFYYGSNFFHFLDTWTVIQICLAIILFMVTWWINSEYSKNRDDIFQYNITKYYEKCEKQNSMNQNVTTQNNMIQSSQNQSSTKQDNTKQRSTSQDNTKQRSASQDSASKDNTTQDSASKDNTTQDSPTNNTNQDSTSCP